jgi:hypothetical protein
MLKYRTAPLSQPTTIFLFLSVRILDQFKLCLPHCAAAVARDRPSRYAGRAGLRANCDAPSHTISLGLVAWVLCPPAFYAH